MLNGRLVLYRVLVTGANGFVGKNLCLELHRFGYLVLACTRLKQEFTDKFESIAIGEIGSNTNWLSALSNVDIVIHLAARVHVMQEFSNDPLVEFSRVNVAGTEHLARSAVKAGVKRFVYVSSIGVNGLFTANGAGFNELNVSNPHDAYALSKWEAEQALRRVASETGLEIVIVRPPLVYGADAPGNFAQMLRFVSKGIPLPFASVKNQRDLIYVGNLVDALLLCASHPKAAGQTYLVCDGEAVSTPNLLRYLAEAMGVNSRVFPFPLLILKCLAKAVGKSAQIDRLLGSLQIDSSKIRNELGWKPPYTLKQGLRLTVAKAVGE